MTEKREYKKIMAGVFLHENEHTRYADGKHKWNIHFLERLEDYEEVFNMILLESITKRMGTDGWAVLFSQVSQLEHSFFADIYVDDIKNFEPIVSIIQTNLIDIPKANIPIVNYYYQGDLDAYIGNLQ